MGDQVAQAPAFDVGALLEVLDQLLRQRRGHSLRFAEAEGLNGQWGDCPQLRLRHPSLRELESAGLDPT